MLFDEYKLKPGIKYDKTPLFLILGGMAKKVFYRARQQASWQEQNVIGFQNLAMSIPNIVSAIFLTNFKKAHRFLDEPLLLMPQLNGE